MPTVAATFPDVATVRTALTVPPCTAGKPRITIMAQSAWPDSDALRDVRWIRAVPGDGVQNRTETATAGALLGLFVAGLVAYAPGAYGFVRTWFATGPLRAAAGTAAESFFEFPSVAVIAIFIVGAAAGAWAGRGFGLPRGLAYRYGLQLRRGRVLVSARVAASDVPNIVTWLHSAGAADVRVSEGRLRLRPGAQLDSLDLPATAGN